VGDHLASGIPPAPEQTPAFRCQRTTVSGVTIARCSRRPAQTRRARTHSSLSQVRSRTRGRVRVGRVRTVSWWRKSRFSSTRRWPGRTQAMTVVSSSQTSSNMPSAWPIYGACEVLPPHTSRSRDVDRALRWERNGAPVYVLSQCHGRTMVLAEHGMARIGQALARDQRLLAG
jgi:hypothetical protein